MESERRRPANWGIKIVNKNVSSENEEMKIHEKQSKSQLFICLKGLSAGISLEFSPLLASPPLFEVLSTQMLTAHRMYQPIGARSALIRLFIV